MWFLECISCVFSCFFLFFLTLTSFQLFINFRVLIAKYLLKKFEKIFRTWSSSFSRNYSHRTQKNLIEFCYYLLAKLCKQGTEMLSSQLYIRFISRASSSVYSESIFTVFLYVAGKKFGIFKSKF